MRDMSGFNDNTQTDTSDDRESSDRNLVSGLVVRKLVDCCAEQRKSRRS